MESCFLLPSLTSRFTIRRGKRDEADFACLVSPVWFGVFAVFPGVLSEGIAFGFHKVQTAGAVFYRVLLMDGDQ